MARRGRWIASGYAALWVVFVIYVGLWIYGNQGMLFDPMLQTDDARTSLFPFHRYDDPPLLELDPIADEMAAFMPPSVSAIYQLLVPKFGIFISSKLVQALCIALVVYAGAVLAFHRRVGIAAGMLIVFFVLHTPFIFFRGIGGGLPRAFAFPILALWVAGAITRRVWVRRLGAILGAFTYPSAMLLVLGAEGFYVLARLLRDHLAAWRESLAFAGLIGACFIAVSPMLMNKPDVGPIHSFGEAVQEPAFYRSGRLGVLPFRSPLTEFPKHLALPFLPAGDSVLPAWLNFWPEGPAELLVAIVPFVILAIPVLRRRAPFPTVSLSLFLSSITIYALSRLAAFQLYSPERYYGFGLVMTAIALPVEVVALLGVRSDAKNGRITNNSNGDKAKPWFTTGIIVALFLFCGTGIDPNRNGMTIDRRDHSDLYAFIETLPADIRIASHPWDGDDIPLWAGRSTMGGFETLQPWFVEAWRRQKQRMRDTLDALYATSRTQVLAYCGQYQVTHLLIRQSRYGQAYRKEAEFIEPFNGYVRAILADVALDELVLFSIPTDAVIYRDGDFVLVDIALLQQAWKSAGSSSLGVGDKTEGQSATFGGYESDEEM